MRGQMRVRLNGIWSLVGHVSAHHGQRVPEYTGFWCEQGSSAVLWSSPGWCVPWWTPTTTTDNNTVINNLIKAPTVTLQYEVMIEYTLLYCVSEPKPYEQWMLPLLANFKYNKHTRLKLAGDNNLILTCLCQLIPANTMANLLIQTSLRKEKTRRGF